MRHLQASSIMFSSVYSSSSSFDFCRLRLYPRLFWLAYLSLLSLVARFLFFCVSLCFGLSFLSCLLSLAFSLSLSICFVDLPAQLGLACHLTWQHHGAIHTIDLLFVLHPTPFWNRPYSIDIGSLLSFVCPFLAGISTSHTSNDASSICSLFFRIFHFSFGISRLPFVRLPSSSILDFELIIIHNLQTLSSQKPFGHLHPGHKPFIYLQSLLPQNLPSWKLPELPCKWPNNFFLCFN